MISFFRAIAVMPVTANLVAPAGRRAQHPRTREGFWFNVGLGFGSLGCSDCGTRSSGGSGGIALGGTVNRSPLLGVFSNGWTKSKGRTTLSAGTAVPGGRYYPSAQGGFFPRGGLGVSRVDLSSFYFGSASESGSGAFAGIGYNMRVAESFSLTPFWHGIGMTFAGGTPISGRSGSASRFTSVGREPRPLSELQVSRLLRDSPPRLV